MLVAVDAWVSARNGRRCAGPRVAVVRKTMCNRMTMALIGPVSIWAMAGCGSSGGGPLPGVCDGTPATSQAATIHVTRSTNSPELIVTVYCDGSAERALGQAGEN